MYGNLWNFAGYDYEINTEITGLGYVVQTWVELSLTVDCDELTTTTRLQKTCRHRRYISVIKID